MNDCGTDPETFSNTYEFLLNGGGTNEGVDLDLEIHNGEEGLQIAGYDPKVKDHNSSDDDMNDDELGRHIKQACGDFSNTQIEERWNSSEKSRPGSEKTTKSGNGKNEIQRKFDEVREKASFVRRISPVLAQAEPDMQPEVPEQRPKSKPPKSRRPKYKNVAIESILVIKGTPAASVAVSSSASQPEISVTASKTATINGVKSPPGRGRGRITSSDYPRSGMPMIRPECIHGYNSNTDYDPNDSLGNCPRVRDEFPPL